MAVEWGCCPPGNSDTRSEVGKWAVEFPGTHRPVGPYLSWTDLLDNKKLRLISVTVECKLLNWRLSGDLHGRLGEGGGVSEGKSVQLRGQYFSPCLLMGM